MPSSATDARERLWRFTAAYRLGHRWQRAGEYARAEAAYHEAISLEPDHRASRLNLAVMQIRLQAYDAALANLEDLFTRERGSSSALSHKTALDPGELVVAYNLALVLRYLERLDEARQWSQRVAFAAFKRTDDERVARIAPAALMLHAGILRDLNKDNGELLEQCAGCALEEPKVQDRELTNKRIVELIGDPWELEWHVRRGDEGASPDARGSYNVACYLARLAELVPDRADKLVPRAMEHLRTALADVHLIPWAAEDPALAVVRGHAAWQNLPAASPGSASADGEPAPASARERSAQTDVPDVALRLVTGLHVDVQERRARRAHDPLDAFEELKRRAGDMDEPGFHLALFEAIAGLRDPVTTYLAPAAIQDRMAVLPLRLVECRGPDGAATIRVDASEPWLADAGLRPGVEVIRWNGKPIEEAIARRIAAMPGADIEGRRARAIATLTHRPNGVLASLDADEVAIEYGDHSVGEIRLDWHHRHAPHVDPAADLQSIDLLVAGIGRARWPHEPVAWSEFEGPTGALFAHLHIRTFEVASASEFVDEVAARLEATPAVGLVLDVRGNGGGSIAAAERLLQLVSPEPISPQPIQFRATRLTARLTRVVPQFRRWYRSIDAAIDRSRAYSDALPLTPGHEHACNAIGQVYEGPVVLVVDALSAGATDILAAGFVDHGLGRVLATAPRGGMAGGVAWRTDDPHVELLPPPHSLPNGAALQLSVARTCRAGGPLAELPVVPDEIHGPRSAGDAGLPAHAARMLADALMSRR
jgi:C-terminal processing protease CtpA/Prc